MAEWPLSTLGSGAGALGFAAILTPILVAFVLALRVRKPADAAEFDGHTSELSPLGVGLSLAASDLALAGALIALPLAASLPDGGLVCLQGLVLGGVIGRFLVSRWMLPGAFAARERSALAPIGERLGRSAGALAARVFALGATLASAGRVFLFVFALHLALGANLPGKTALGGWLGFGLLALFVWAAAALLALVRGLRGSVACDGFLLLVLLVAVVAGLVGLVATLGGGWSTFGEVLRGSRKHIPLAFETSAGLANTFWTALFVSSLASAAHYGADPQQQTRLLATGSLERARKALWISLAGVLPAAGLCLVGAGLLAWKERNPLGADAQRIVAAFDLSRWPVLVAGELAPLARALVLAGFAACAVLAAKSTLGALVQVASAGRRRRRAPEPNLGWMRRSIATSAVRILIVGLLLGPSIATHPTLLQALLVAGECALGLLFAASGLALLRRPPAAEGLFWALPLALTATFLLALRGPSAERAAAIFGALYLLVWAGWRFLPDWFGYRRRLGALVELAAVVGALLLLYWSVRFGLVPLERHFRFDPEWVWLPLSPAWYVPTGAWIGFVFGCLLARGSAGSGEGIAQTSAR